MTRSRTLLFALVAWAIPALPALAQKDALVADYDGSKVIRYHESSGKPIDHFVGQGISPLDHAWGMTYGPDGNLYVASAGNNSVERYNGTTGEPIDTFIAPGTGELDRPTGIAFRGDVLYVCSHNNNKVLRYNRFTKAPIDPPLIQNESRLDGPNDLKFDSDGTLYVASLNTNTVLKFGPAGNFLLTAIEGLMGPTGLVIDSATGNLYASGAFSSNVLVRTPAGVVSQLVTQGSHGLNAPYGMAITPDNSLLVCSLGSAQVLRFSKTTGTYLGVYVTQNSGSLFTPVSLIFQPETVCPADFDGNGFVNGDDFDAFVDAFAAGC